MTENVKKGCQQQLATLSKAPNLTEGDLFTLSALLIKLVDSEKKPDTMSPEDIEKSLKEHSMIYSVLDNFVAKCGKSIPLEKEIEAFKSQRTKYSELKEQLVKVKGECEADKNDILSIEAEINALYESKGQLFKKYEELKDREAKLQKLSSEFNPDEIDQLEESVEKLEEATNRLIERKNNVERTTTECLEELSKILPEIDKASTERKDELEKVKTEVDQVVQLHKICKETYDGYKSWVDISKSPWKTLSTELDSDDFENLKGVLDEKTLKEKNQWIMDIDTNLRKLDSLVKKCQNASQADHDKIINDAGK